MLIFALKQLRALAQKIKMVPGSVEEPLIRGGGDSVRENALAGNVCADEIPC